MRVEGADRLGVEEQGVEALRDLRELLEQPAVHVPHLHLIRVHFGFRIHFGFTVQQPAVNIPALGFNSFGLRVQQPAVYVPQLHLVVGGGLGCGVEG